MHSTSKGAMRLARSAEDLRPVERVSRRGRQGLNINKNRLGLPSVKKKTLRKKVKVKPGDLFNRREPGARVLNFRRSDRVRIQKILTLLFCAIRDCLSDFNIKDEAKFFGKLLIYGLISFHSTFTNFC